MSVTNYTPDKCRYYIGKLEDIVYLVSEDALKDIKIDNGNAFVASVSESPLSIKCYNLKLAEEESFDERYKFTHTVTFSVNGYMNKDNFNDKYYVILKDVEGTYWLVNPLFPSKVTYNYKLGYNENHTDFTLATASNHPVLRLNEFNVDDVHECEAYWYDGIAELKLNEKKYSAHIDNHIKYTNASGFKDVDFNDRTCVVTEEFDGETVRHQIDFNIMLSQYKNDWHYSLLEFKDNTYAAVFKTLNEKYGLCGFSMGLQPSFTIDADSESMSNTIKITLKDAHTDGLTLDFYDSVDYEYLSAKTWVYTADYGGYECIGEGTARYLLKKEVDAFDNETGNYMVLDGYESYFQESSWPLFHIAGTFETTETFSNMDCRSSDCTLNTSLSSQIEFYEEGCQNFYIEADSNWVITPSKDYITVSPSSGYAHTSYDVVVCNTMQPTDTADTSTLTIEYCNTSSTVNVVVVEDTNACLPQGSSYTVPANGQVLTIPTRCCVESVRETAGFGVSTVVLSNSIQATIPQNNTGLNRQSVLLVVYCDGTSGNIIINQSNIFEDWRVVGTLCDGRNKVQRQYKWTGTTISNYTKTDEYRDIVLEYNSYECYSTDEWNYRKYVLVDNDWFCDDGNKYGLLRMYVSMDNVNWKPTDIYKKGGLVEEHSTDCCWDDKWNNYPYTKYEVVGGYICNDGNKYQKLLRYFSMDNVVWESSDCIYKIGDLIELDSEDCGYINTNGYGTKYRWFKTDDTICIETSSCDIYRWANANNDICSGTTKYRTQVKQISEDGGITWNNVQPIVNRLGTIISRKSTECGYSNNHDYSQDYFKFVAVDNCLFYVYQIALQYSIDSGNTWINIGGNGYSHFTPVIPAGNEVWWKHTGRINRNNFNNTTEVYGRFNVEGNVMSLLYGDNFRGKTSLSGTEETFTALLAGNENLLNAENLVLPATALSPYCYAAMFRGCSSLTTAPELPATTLVGYCYYEMFAGCTSLTEAPVLPATTLKGYCYCDMFEGCTSLEITPELLPVTMSNGCYGGMFKGCTNLTTVSDLPTTNLEYSSSYLNGCYTNMFAGCTSLEYMPIISATTLSPYCFTGMFSGCANLKYLTIISAESITHQACDGMFAGCTSLTTIPYCLLPATTLGYMCYDGMFKGCTNLLNTPKLPATTLAEKCYALMFSGCTSLTEIEPFGEATGIGSHIGMFAGCTSLEITPELPATILADSCYKAMFQNCTNLKTITSLPATRLASQCYREMFKGCTNLVDVPHILPATTLYLSCYNEMFRDCKSLVEAPELPATRLDDYCYQNMFNGCTRLNYIKCLATNISASNCTSNWVYGVQTNAGIFVKNQSMTGWAVSTDGIPQNWTIQNA